MDTIVVSTIVNILGEKLGSALLNKFSLLKDVKEDLEALEKTISTIKDVLDDAEQCCLKNKQVYSWLRELKDVAYDADDLLDTINLEAEKRKAESCGQTSRVIGNFVSNVNPFKRSKLGKEIRSINKRLDTIVERYKKFDLQITAVGPSEETYLESRETISKVDKDSICGRDSEREEIMRQLKQSDGNEHISVISIVGLGGLGKTTLAQLVYNNEDDLKGYFHPKIWIYVSQKFNAKEIVRSINVSISHEKKCDLTNFNDLAEELTKNLKGKRFLLVLDDIWNEDQMAWEDNLLKVLNCGAPGSKIIATTRSMEVARIMKSTVIELEKLSEEMSWILFKQRAFSGSERGFVARYLTKIHNLIIFCMYRLLYLASYM